ncbi:hypothetical protein LEL_10932 [Akanthomyces lecanii RCEF 1005]|uniref:Uncharacterized protein n=1 Tax=Akanthomyces lecanii RCEF 1005 TaxID=1081108 RepID=A0A167PYE6_CORDF|nr:hypothetical protein LEL_10932 [Akanthomyces lecanii RCEF 1005]
MAMDYEATLQGRRGSHDGVERGEQRDIGEAAASGAVRGALAAQHAGRHCIGRRDCFRGGGGRGDAADDRERADGGGEWRGVRAAGHGSRSQRQQQHRWDG